MGSYKDEPVPGDLWGRSEREIRASTAKLTAEHDRMKAEDAAQANHEPSLEERGRTALFGNTVDELLGHHNDG